MSEKLTVEQIMGVAEKLAANAIPIIERPPYVEAHSYTIAWLKLHFSTPGTKPDYLGTTMWTYAGIEIRQDDRVPKMTFRKPDGTLVNLIAPTNEQT